MGDIEASYPCSPRDELGSGVARATAVVQHGQTGYVAQRVQVIVFRLAKNAGLIDADDQRAIVASKLFGFVPLLFELEFLVDVHGVR